MSYIVVEGLDYSGKSTLTNEIYQKFKSRLVSEPFSESFSSAKIKKLIIEDKLESYYETQLLIATRVELFKKLNNYMRNNSSTLLISDRSFISNMVYQGKTEEEAKHILALNTSVLSSYGYNLFPNIVVYLTIPYHIALERSEKRGKKDGKDNYTLWSKHQYESLQTQYEEALNLVKEASPSTYVITVPYEDGKGSTQEILQDIEKQLLKLSSVPIKQKQ